MKTSKFETNIAMTIVITILLIILGLAVALNSSAQGYHIVIEKGYNVTVRNATSLEQLDKICKVYYPESNFNYSELFKGSVFFEIRDRNKYFYVEVCKIVSTRNGGRKLKRLKKKEIKYFETFGKLR